MDVSRGAVVFVKRDDARLYLLVLHAKGAHWDFPKGHPLPGEDMEETILREVREETGCEVELLPGYEDAVSYALPSGKAKRVDYRLARLAKRGCVPLPNKEIRGLGWFTPEEAGRILTYENARELLRKVEGFLRAQ